MASRIRSRRRAARTALAIGLLVLLAATVGMAAALETNRPDWRDPEFGHRLARLQEAKRESPLQPLVVVIGTSRTQNAIAPEAMGFPDEPGSPRIFNFGQSASPPLKELLTLHRVLDAGIPPAAVIVEVLPGTLCTDGAAEEQLATQAARLSAADLRHLAPFCERPAVLRGYWVNARIGSWHSPRLSLMSHWLPRWLPWSMRLDGNWNNTDKDGFQPIVELPSEIRGLAVAHAQKEYAAMFANFRAGSASTRAMRELVAVCRAKDIRVAFFIPSVSSEFRASFAPGVYEAGEEYLQKLAQELDVTVFPALAGTSEDEFIDGHHMMKHGAERYSRWLADTHLKAFLAGLAP